MTAVELQSIAHRAARILKLGKTPRMRIYNRRRGCAHPYAGWFSIPKWSTTRHRQFAIYYLVHELCHFMPRTSIYRKEFSGWQLRSHSKQMRVLESEVCERFGMRLVYRGTVYPTEIRCLDTGRKICDDVGNPAMDDPRHYESPASLI